MEGTDFDTGSARPSIGGNYGENHQDSKWVNNQTTILAENGGNIKVGETLTKVSLRFYGTKAMWPYIVKHNPKVIKNPDNVPYGTTIEIPELTKE